LVVSKEKAEFTKIEEWLMVAKGTLDFVEIPI
jgi:hypothetical protein